MIVAQPGDGGVRPASVGRGVCCRRIDWMSTDARPLTLKISLFRKKPAVKWTPEGERGQAAWLRL